MAFAPVRLCRAESAGRGAAAAQKAGFPGFPTFYTTYFTTEQLALQRLPCENDLAARPGHNK
jgi:hypothetical protein